jgi:DNA-binding NarL/FixJ family response regulator
MGTSLLHTHAENYAEMNRPDERPKICIVGSNQLHYELLSFCLENELRAECMLHEKLPAGVHCSAENGCREVWLFDCLGLEKNELEQRFQSFVAAKQAEILVALFNVAPKFRLEAFIRQYKIRGIFYKDESRHIFLRGIRAILDGRLWLSRKLMSDCILISKERFNPFMQSKKSLSCRETVILKCVASGASNQEIADQLQISVHTVKTHLYKIYRKLDVPNRLQASRWAKAVLLDYSNPCESAISASAEMCKPY